MKKLLDALNAAAEWLDAGDDSDEPAFDPVHLGSVLIAALVVVGALYWLLWTTFVYEGGILSKMAALANTNRGPEAFDGWIGNASGLVLTVFFAAALQSVFKQAARKAA